MKKCMFMSFMCLVLLLSSLICYAQQQGALKSDGLPILAEKFVGLLAEEDFSSAVNSFDRTMKGALPPEKLEGAWNSIIIQAGLFEKKIGVRSEKIKQYNIIFVTCKFEEAILDVKLVFNKAKQISGLWFVPNTSVTETEYDMPPYVDFDTFKEKEIKIGTGKWILPGTLTIPLHGVSFPAVVLVHGSGPHDRDESIGPNKPFRDLAWGLASQKIVVLRYEKRTKEHAVKLAPIKDNITVKEETMEDVLSAVSALRKTKDVDNDKIFVLGHSLGGMLLPRIGEMDPNIAGFICMAGATKPLEDIILEQISYILSLDGKISKEEEKQIELLKKQVAKVKDPGLSIKTSSTDLPLGISPTYWLDLRGYDPLEVAKNLKHPMLILQGERDYQVTMENFKKWRKFLSFRQNVKFRKYTKLNHLFIEGKGKSIPAEYKKAGYVAGVVINDIANWLKNQ